MVNSLAAFDNSQFFDRLKQEQTNLPLFKGSITYDSPIFDSFSHQTILQQAKQQVLLDWNRNLHSYYIANKLDLNIKQRSIFELRNGKQFESIDELYTFFKKYLLIGMNTDEHEQMLEQSILHLHHGGIMHAAGIAISKRLLKGFAYPSPTFSFEVILYPLETGIGIEENLKLKSIAIPDQPALIAQDTPDLKFNINHYSCIEKKSAYGKVEANSLTTNITCSNRVQDILDFTKNDIINETSQVNSLTPLLNFFNWPLNLLLDQLGLISEVSPENMDKEKRWLDTLAETSKNISLKTEIQKNKIINNIDKIYHGHLHLNSILKPLNQLNLKKITKLQKLSAVHLKSLKLLKKTSTEINHSQPEKIKYIETLDKHLSYLNEEQLILSKKIKLLINLKPDDSLTPTFLTSVIEKLQASILKLDLEKKQCRQILSLFKQENKFSDDYINSYDELLTEDIIKYNRLKLILDRTKYDISQLKSKLIDITNKLNQLEDISNKDLGAINAQTLNSEDLELGLANLKNSFKKINNNDDYIKFSHQKKSTLNMYKLYEKIHTNKQQTASLSDLEIVLDDISEIKKEIDILLKSEHDLEINFNEFIDDLSDRFESFNKLTQYYINPNILVEQSLIEPEVKIKNCDIEVEFFNKIKNNVLKQLKKYSEPSLGWLLSGQWGKQNTKRATSFTTTINLETSLESILILLKKEYAVTQTQVQNENGDYRTTLSDAINYVSKFVIDNNFAMEEPNNSLLIA